jgi:hypothetical protein
MADFTKQVYAKVPEAQQQLILVKTNVAGYFFDAVMKTEHQTEVEITEHPVQLGANIADHAYNEPATVTMDIGMSDVMPGIISSQFSDASSRSLSAYQTLLKLQSNREPLQIHTRLRTYKNMLIEQIIVPDDFKTLFGLRATVRFKEIFVVSVGKVKVSARSQVTGSTNRGNQQPVEIPPTLLKQLQDLYGGM